ncbi:hypothetical protein LSH36_185g05010 [Paralvinella palmiformis]|uniref:Uncharacterized protein n=1 Tax=Paralvinella palmiformis TaxID=53620 RepID=A0AAD9JQY7_9ANNE|nr:hypothetical protein LSH36_185g05010 [Paralvinella palmiformis]
MPNKRAISLIRGKGRSTRSRGQGRYLVAVTLSCRFLVSSPAFDAIKALTSEIHKKFKDAIGELLTKMAAKFKAIEVEKWEFFEQFNDNTAYALGITKHAMQPDGKTFRRNK